MEKALNKKIEPMTRSAVMHNQDSSPIDALLVTAHPQRWAAKTL
jgi:hypothetical protein